MTLGERLFQYRNSIGMSQEKLAEEIGVTRQTISKWETDQSTPDFDKIEPICAVFGITPDELVIGQKRVEDKKSEHVQDDYNKKRNRKKAIVLSISIFLYCIATFALPYMVEVLKYEDAHAVMIWAGLCTIATVIIVYFFTANPKENNKVSDAIKENRQNANNKVIVESNAEGNFTKAEKEIDEEKENKTEALVIEIIATFFLIIYLLVSFITMAWHITWIIWIVFALVELIVKLIFSMKGERKSEK